MAFVEKTGKSVEEAIASALEELHVAKEAADVEILDEGKKGFFGFGQKDAKVRVTVSAETSEEMSSIGMETVFEEEMSGQPAIKDETCGIGEKAEGPQAKENKKFTVNEEAVSKARDFLQQVFNAMKIEVVMEKFIKKSDGSVTFKLHGDDMGILIGKHGQTLDSLQYLTNLVANKNSTDRVRIIIDVENYRTRRVETLSRLAVRLADKVKRNGEKVALEPMNPHERKIIHMTLQGDSRVVTSSEGEEPLRHVVIELKK
ncbi:MAG: protein jag [Phascolarctobacterium sp.]|nr:protein jag [Phascolarctobacterium sp.]